MEFKVGEWYEGPMTDHYTGEETFERVRCIVVDVPEIPNGCVFVNQDGDLVYEPDETLKHLPGCDGWDWKLWTPPEPGEGWRLLAAGEVIEPGDEAWRESIHGERGWHVSHCAGDVVSESELIDPDDEDSYWVRRRVEPVKPCVPTGWVQVGGISGGMLWFAPDDGAECAPISAQAENTGESVIWRELEVGETIREGDEVYVGGWEIVVKGIVGMKMRLNDPSKVRRRVRVESPGWRYLDEGETVKAGDESRATRSCRWVPAVGTVGMSVMADNHELFRRKISPV